MNGGGRGTRKLSGDKALPIWIAISKSGRTSMITRTPSQLANNSVPATDLTPDHFCCPPSATWNHEGNILVDDMVAVWLCDQAAAQRGGAATNRNCWVAAAMNFARDSSGWGTCVKSISATISAAYSIPPREGLIPAFCIASRSNRLYRSRWHFGSGASQPTPSTALNAAESTKSQRSIWGSGMA